MAEQSDSDREWQLIARAREGDSEAFCQLAERYQQRVYALALHYTGNPAEAEDLSQEAWLKAFRNIHRFRGESGFYTWIRRIAVNSFMDERRRSWPAEPLDEVREAGYEEPVENALLLRAVRAHLAALSPGERMTLLLKHLEGMTVEEIAAVRGTSAGTVKKTLFRAITKLRDLLGVAAERRTDAFLREPDRSAAR